MTPSTTGSPSVHPTFSLNIDNPPIVSRDTHASSSTHISPILATRPPPDTSSPQPQYAEDLTPLKLRRRRRHAVLQDAIPAPTPLTPGLSLSGFTTEDGEVFRGATYDPRLGPPAVDDDALTIAESSNSSSSSWSWASDIQRGRRATMAAIGRFGERLGVRRGSAGSDTSSETGTLPSRRSMSVGRRLSRRLTRTNTRESATSERPRRQHLPRRREFMLLLPPQQPALTVEPISRISTPGSERADEPYPPDRLITSPDLPTVLDRIRTVRLAAGILPEPPYIETTHRRGRHARNHQVHAAHGHSSHARLRPKLKHGHQSFLNPPLPRPGQVHMKSRLEALRTTSQVHVPRPKSVSDLIGMANPYTPGRSDESAKDKSPDLTPTVSREDVREENRGCWWLDVSCPGWEDLRDIGEVLGLHPLTLEDVLQQDPREKFDIFDRLGYYFVVVRALDEEYFKYTPGSSTTLVGPGEKAYIDSSPSASPQLRANNEKKKEGRRRGWGMGRTSGKAANKEGEKVEIVEDNPGKEGLEGVGVGAVNLYLVVFADGIVSFHFDDISKHTKHVLDRILSSSSVQVAPGSDWIAHGLLDSIVDAFFPLIRYVDGEVDDIDSLTVDPSVDPKSVIIPSPAVDPDGVEMDEKGMAVRLPLPRPAKRLTKAFEALKKAKDSIPTVHLPHVFIYLKLFLLPVTSAVQKPYEHPDSQVMPRATMLRHMTEMRKLVTGLTRLLGTKHQVIGLMRKRVAESGEGVEQYIGDIEDHILLLQNSLLHYEYILSHCQPAYISQLNLGFKIVKGRTDVSILALSTVAIGILPMQFIISIFSMNVRVPHNGDPDNGHLETDGSQAPVNWFGGVVASLVLVSAWSVLTIRYWRWAARVKFARRRREPLPNTWDGFWGFR